MLDSFTVPSIEALNAVEGAYLRLLIAITRVRLNKRQMAAVLWPCMYRWLWALYATSWHAVLGLACLMASLSPIFLHILWFLSFLDKVVHIATQVSTRDLFNSAVTVSQKF